MNFCESFAPVARPDARMLVLGSLPGAESLRRGQYYANSQNAFWKILGELAGTAPESAYEQRLEALRNAGLALWDVCAAARRQGSLDSQIKDVRPNDFKGFLLAHPAIALICFNGQTAARLFERHVAPDLPVEARAITRKTLPSTSPAHAGMRFEQKRALWRAALMPPEANS
ncbi:DNA-deoxyinosine glycosylase [uncultured Rhodoblastus sp.]|uniref:DNA-deoxyinosine glycosylase n=1 Tax=uncultured Rhodoblastus sp. TaxID=543037 RepID=UPI0025E0AA76|nr:DNA-deoxyinosine glycosylase [uncultured Rhodoblastus sp.]